MQVQKKDFKSAQLSVTSPSQAAAIALRRYLVRDLVLGSAENDLCCHLVAGHEARFVSSHIILSPFYSQRLPVLWVI